MAAPGEQVCGLHLRGGVSAFNQQRADRLVTMLRAGNTVVAACRAVGIADQTFRHWMRRGLRGDEPYASWRSRVDSARGEAEVRHVSQIAAAAAEDWRAATWMIDRRLAAIEEESQLDTRELAEEAAADARAEAIATLEAIGEPVELNQGAIERYAAAVGAWASVEAQWVHAGRPALTLGGATGSASVPHPLLAQIALARREAAQLASLLGMDPLGRLKLARHVGPGRPPGAASAPDRAAGPPRRRLRAVP